MFRKIMVPVDLAHTPRLGRALQTAADLARLYEAEVCYVAVTAPIPGAVAHNPQEFADKLDTFAQDQAASHGHTASARSVVSHDPAIDLDRNLLRIRKEIDADLVVMASHVPGVADYLFPSHGGRMAKHSEVSVMIVRES